MTEERKIIDEENLKIKKEKSILIKDNKTRKDKKMREETIAILNRLKYQEDENVELKGKIIVQENEKKLIKVRLEAYRNENKREEELLSQYKQLVRSLQATTVKIKKVSKYKLSFFEQKTLIQSRMDDEKNRIEPPKKPTNKRGAVIRGKIAPKETLVTPKRAIKAQLPRRLEEEDFYNLIAIIPFDNVYNRRRDASDRQHSPDLHRVQHTSELQQTSRGTSQRTFERSSEQTYQHNAEPRHSLEPEVSHFPAPLLSKSEMPSPPNYHHLGTMTGRSPSAFHRHRSPDPWEGRPRK